MHVCRIVALAAVLGGFTAPQASAQAEARIDAAIEWSEDVDGFGGFSGFEVDANGTRFIAVSDDGLLAHGTLLRDGAGTLTGVKGAKFSKLKDPDGEPWGRYLTDAEGLALGEDGSFYVSFEGEHRVVRYAELGAAAEVLPVPDAFAELQRNSALEALAVDGDGRLVTLPERSGAWERPFPIWRFDGTWLQDASLPRRDKLLPVGGDFGPDGRYYLLERELVGIFGFRSRIRSFAYGPDGFTDERTVLTTPLAAFDNLEGLSVWRDEAGHIRLTMISDDNFNAFQQTQIVEFVLTE